MADPRRARGAAGEQAAAELLTGLGYEILERNFRTRYGELDLIAVDDEWLVICEVRSRVGRPSVALEAALESIGPRKRMQLRKMAREWFGMTAHPGTRRMRFDAVAVALTSDGRPLAIRHVREAF